MRLFTYTVSSCHLWLERNSFVFGCKEPKARIAGHRTPRTPRGGEGEPKVEWVPGLPGLPGGGRGGAEGGVIGEDGVGGENEQGFGGHRQDMGGSSGSRREGRVVGEGG